MRLAPAFALAAAALTMVVLLASPTLAQARWSKPLRVLQAPSGSYAPDDFFTAVSCPTRSFCAALDSFGRELTYNGRRWSAAKPIWSTGQGSTDRSISCPSSRFCVAPAPGARTAIYNGRSWRLVKSPAATASCSSSRFCLGVTAAKHPVSFNGKSWSRANHSITISGNTYGAVSCSSSSFCALN
jgi:hypothetical protein